MGIDWSQMHWPTFAMGVTGVAVLLLVPALLARRWTWFGLVVAIANLALLSVNAAAPVRGLVDPDYVGYGFGWLQAGKGLPVTLMAGGVVLGALVSALLVLRNGSGPIMLLLAAFDGFFALDIGVPLAQVLSDPSKVAIQFGEYLTVSALVAIPLLIVVFVLPFAAGALIGFKQAFGAPAEA